MFLFQAPSQLTMGLQAMVTSSHRLIENVYGLIVLCFRYFSWIFYCVLGYGLIIYGCALKNMGTG